MDIEHLKRFIVVGKCLNFSKAADMLFITQPTLSHTINSIENTLGTVLFLRDTKNVKLSPAGEIFLKTAIEIVNSYDKGIDEVKKEIGLKSDSLSIGFSGPGMDNSFPLWLRKFKEANPGVAVQLERILTNDVESRFDEKKIDIALLYEMSAANVPNIETEILFSEQFELLVPDDHPFAKRKQINLQELGDETMIIRDAQLSPHYYDLITGICKKRGYKPNFMTVRATFGEIHRMVAEGLGVAIMSHSNVGEKSYSAQGGVFVHIDDEDDLRNRILLAWRGTLSDNARAFKKIVEMNISNQKKNKKM